MIPTPEDFKKLAEENERLRIGMKALGTARFISCPGPGAVLVVEDRADMEAASVNPDACHPHPIMHGVAFRDELQKAEQALAEAKKEVAHQTDMACQASVACDAALAREARLVEALKQIEFIGTSGIGKSAEGAEATKALSQTPAEVKHAVEERRLMELLLLRVRQLKEVYNEDGGAGEYSHPIEFCLDTLDALDAHRAKRGEK